MAEGTERSRQESFLEEETGTSDIQPPQGPAPSPPPLLRPPAGDTASAASGKRSHSSEGEEQLALPLGVDEEPRPALSASRKRQRRGRPGFTPVMRDPEVARSYSENAALDNAVAEGLAQVLARLSPEELAELRAKVARAALRNGKHSPSR